MVMDRDQSNYAYFRTTRYPEETQNRVHDANLALEMAVISHQSENFYSNPAKRIRRAGNAPADYWETLIRKASSELGLRGCLHRSPDESPRYIDFAAVGTCCDRSGPQPRRRTWIAASSNLVQWKTSEDANGLLSMLRIGNFSRSIRGG